MKATARGELWERLRAEDLVAGEFPNETTTPWFVKVMQSVAGWIGAICLLGFIGAGFSFVLRGVLGALLAAGICSFGARAIFHRPRGDFAGQFGLAIGIAGQALFAVAIAQAINGEKFIGFFLFFCVETALTLLIPSFAHRICSTLGAVAAVYLALAQLGLHGLALPLIAAGCASLWRGEVGLAEGASLWQPAGYGLAIGVLLTATVQVFGAGAMFFSNSGAAWLYLSTSLVSALLLAVVVHILRRLEIARTSDRGVALLFCTLLVLVGFFPVHGLAAALLILILGFSGGNRVLFGLGLLAMVLVLSRYYFQMHETLLFKSMILGSTGALLLLIRWGLGKTFPANPVKESPRHA